MERRTLLKTAGSIGAAATVGGAGLAAFSGSAAAAQINEFDIADPDVTTTDDGTIDTFTVTPDVTLEYDGIDEEVEALIMQFGVVNPGVEEPSGPSDTTPLSTQVENDPNRRVNVADEGSLDTHAGRYTWDFESFDVLADSPWSASDFEDTTEDGEAAETPVQFYCMGALVPANSNARMIDPPGYITESGDVVVRVNNEPATTGAGVDGDSTVSGENQEP